MTDKGKRMANMAWLQMMAYALSIDDSIMPKDIPMPDIEAITKEYELIQQKKSKLSYNERCEIIKQYNKYVDNSKTV